MSLFHKEYVIYLEFKMAAFAGVNICFDTQNFCVTDYNEYKLCGRLPRYMF